MHMVYDIHLLIQLCMICKCDLDVFCPKSVEIHDFKNRVCNNMYEHGFFYVWTWITFYYLKEYTLQ